MKNPRKNAKSSSRPCSLNPQQLHVVSGGGRKASDAYFVRVDSETTTG